ncbi:hypothetical protein BH23BAC3_BH23BAC3_28670 [soil metagenome]
MIRYVLIIGLISMLSGLAACSNSQSQSSGNALMSDPEFKEYWYTGKAELSRYDMQEIRYGEVRDGEAVLVFVTEDFLTDKQVKLESAKNGRETSSVLKLNFMKEFVTGIYKYNMMTSIFTPVDYQNRPRSLKVASSSQEWCGMTYFQLNLDGNNYEVKGHSYFESEGDYETSVEAIWLEDELWTNIRLSPDLLPEGEIDIIPGAFSVRATNSTWKTESVLAEKKSWEGEGFPGENLMSYSLDYKDRGRTLTIVYESEFPHKIAGWVQTRKVAGDTLTAKSVRTHSVNSAYWDQNANSDESLRDKLGL